MQRKLQETLDWEPGKDLKSVIVDRGHVISSLDIEFMGNITVGGQGAGYTIAQNGILNLIPQIEQVRNSDNEIDRLPLWEIYENDLWEHEERAVLENITDAGGAQDFYVKTSIDMAMDHCKANDQCLLNTMSYNQVQIKIKTSALDKCVEDLDGGTLTMTGGKINIWRNFYDEIDFYRIYSEKREKEIPLHIIASKEITTETLLDLEGRYRRFYIYFIRKSALGDYQRVDDILDTSVADPIKLIINGNIKRSWGYKDLKAKNLQKFNHSKVGGVLIDLDEKDDLSTLIDAGNRNEIATFKLSFMVNHIPGAEELIMIVPQRLIRMM